MPFQSEKQRRYLWANEPEIARDWTDTYGSGIAKALGGRIGFWNGSGNIRQQPHQPRDLLVQNNPYGTRPRYQPPGGGETSLGSGAATSGGGGPPGGGDPGMTYTAPPTRSRIQDERQEDFRKKQMSDLLARQQAEKDYTRTGQIKPGPQLGWAGSGVGGGLGSWASQFAGSKIGGGLGSMLFGPWGMLLGAMFGRGVGKRGWQASQTKNQKESLQDILFGQNTLLSNVLNKKKTPTNIGGEADQGILGIKDNTYSSIDDPINDYDYRPSEKMYFNEQETSMPKNLGASISELENWMSENPQLVQQKHINYAQALQTAQHNKALEEDPNRPGLRVSQLWE